MAVTRHDLARTRRERVTAPVALALAVLGASVLLHVRSPHESGSYLFCPWLVLTGTFCPGCGGLRAVHDLTRGDVAAAASSNLLLVGAAPVVLGLWLRWFTARWHGAGQALSRHGGVVAVALLIVASLAFWVARNVPGADWLAP